MIHDKISRILCSRLPYSFILTFPLFVYHVSHFPFPSNCILLIFLLLLAKRIFSVYILTAIRSDGSLVKIISLTVNDNDRREILHFKLPDRFRSQILIADDL